MVTRLAFLAMLSCLTVHAAGQATSSEILGEIRDPDNAIVNQASVSLRAIETNSIWKKQSDPEGRFRFPLLPIGSYEITVEKSGFRRLVRAPIILRLNQRPELVIHLELAGVAETMVVSADAPLINSTNAEIGYNFDPRRLAELPLAPNRNILNIVLQVPGVIQLSSGNVQQSTGGVSFPVNGSRLRSNNFIVDGQDSNGLNLTGLVQEINNPDTIAEIRLVTSQFAPEYGRTTGSVVNIITKSGTNFLHGTAYWFYNGNRLNSRSNLDKQAGFAAAPWRVENQFAGTLGGPIVKDRTFFFGSLLRWTDHRFASGSSITGVPTAEGKSLLESIAGDRPQVRALLEHLPEAEMLTGASMDVTVPGQSVNIPLGRLSGKATNKLDVWQSSGRVDHRLGNVHTVGGRYLFDDRYDISGQSVPPGLTVQSPQRRQAASAFMNSFLSKRFNELRISYQRLGSDQSAVDPKAANIPSIEIQNLGLTGVVPDPTRTAIGLPFILPMFSHNNVYHLSDVLGILVPNHSLKTGIDLRRAEQNYFIGLNDRGRLTYSTLQDFIDDKASISLIAVPSGPQSRSTHHFRSHDIAFFLQDEWRSRPNLTLTYGVRYESPGTPTGYLVRISKEILADHNNDPAFAFGPVPKRDTNNWAPRLGFNYRFGEWPGMMHAFTGRGQLVMRGGYSRAYDQSFNQIFQSIANGFPFLASISPGLQNAFSTLRDIRSGLNVPAITTVNQARTIVGADFRAPVAEQFSLQFQRELANDWAMALGWIATKGTGLFQNVDANPTLPSNNNSGSLRIDPGKGAVRLRCNCASSIYHSLQSSLEKRFSTGFSLAAHYTWSSFIDDASEIYNASNGDVAVSQDSFNRRADRGRSAYDRPHRLTVNAILELPFLRNTGGVLSHFFGGWQINGFLTLQSGSPFTPLNGSDPGSRLAGISGLVMGTAIRPNLATSLDLSSMSIEEIIRAGGATLFSRVDGLNPIGNAGRNILRADGINRVDFGINKNLKLRETKRLQLRAEFYNLFNSRDFGIPQAVITNSGFGLQGNTNGGNRRIVVGLRSTF